MRAVAVSPAKVILFGEHFVVGGNTALSMAIDLPTIVTIEEAEKNAHIISNDLGLGITFSPQGEVLESVGLNAEGTLRPIFEVAKHTLDQMDQSRRGLKITVRSNVPIGMGLGSSAATAVSTVSGIATLFGKEMSREAIFEAAYSLERIVHGHPSGVDQATVTYGGLIAYRAGRIRAKLEITSPPLLVIGNTGMMRSTGKFVGKVAKMRTEEPDEYSRIAADAQRICERAMKALREGDQALLGSLMNENQKLLELIGVSSPELEGLITAARSAGALGAKLTGGGGGGCMIAITKPEYRSKVAGAIEQAGGRIVPSAFAPHGVRSSREE